MKNNFWVVLLSFLLAASSCSKSEISEKVFRVKILDEVCSNAVVQIQDPALYQYGVNGYVNSDSTYDHVFSTRFSCADMAKMQTLTADKKGLVIKIRLIEKQISEPACSTCAATVPGAPSAFQWVALTEDWSN
ncbi:MAG TPA: hypothetical protein VGE25_11410 [Sediminibacterium sp.]